MGSVRLPSDPREDSGRDGAAKHNRAGMSLIGMHKWVFGIGILIGEEVLVLMVITGVVLIM